MTCSDGELAVGIQGRLDTITATDLLQGFRDVAEPVASITLDVSDMSYISSAGLRVLLIMYKSILGKGTFRIDGVTDSVREIFEVTGFADLLLAD
jgi:anti-anti-sigma factor